MFQHLNFEHVLTRLIMYRLRETGHMDPVLNRQWILATSNNLFVYGMELMRKAKNGSTNGSTVCQI